MTEFLNVVDGSDLGRGSIPLVLNASEHDTIIFFNEGEAEEFIKKNPGREAPKPKVNTCIYLGPSK